MAFSLDGKRLFVGVGSASNLDDPDDHPSETHRADILEYTPEGKFVRFMRRAFAIRPVLLWTRPQDSCGAQ